MVRYPRAVGNPRELPELRAALMDTARSGGPWSEAELQKLLMSLPGPGSSFRYEGRSMIVEGPEGFGPAEMQRRIEMAVGQADNTVRWYRERLPEAQLIHVTPEMTDFICAAAEGVPPNLTLSIDDAPAVTALVVFGRPVMGTDAGPERPGEEVRVDGILWGPVSLPARDVPWYDERSSDLRIHGVSVAMFRMIAPEHLDTLAAGFELLEPMWVPLGRTDWPWGDELAMKPSEFLPNPSPAQWDSMQEDRRLLASIWAVVNQKRLVNSHEVYPYPQTSKRLARAGHGGRDERVQIIHLRRSEAVTAERPEPTGRHVSVRFPVRPFWRRQPYGPNRSKRRLVLIPAHWRGPEGAPITHAERIWEVDR